MNPIRFEADYAEPRNRLTVFFRLIVAIPWYIWLSLYGVVAFLAAIVAWFALLFTKRYPSGLYDFVAGYVKLSAQIGGFAMLVTDEWPPFMPDRDDYPVRVEVAPQQVEYRRAQTFFKYVLSFPQQLILVRAQLPLTGCGVRHLVADPVHRQAVGDDARRAADVARLHRLGRGRSCCC